MSDGITSRWWTPWRRESRTSQHPMKRSKTRQWIHPAKTTFGFASDEEGDSQFTFDPPAEGFIVQRSDAVILNNLTFLGKVEDTAGFSSGLDAGGSGEDQEGESGIDEEDTYANQFLELYHTE